MRTAIFIPARLESHRLPQKHLLKIKECECIAHLIDRVKLTKLPRLIFLCVPMTLINNKLIDLAERENILWIQGDATDILKRYINATYYWGIDFIVNIDGDDLFCEPSYIDKIIERYLETNCDVVSCKGLPFGVAPLGFTSNALRVLVREGKGGDTGWGKLFTENTDFNREIIQAEPKHNHPEMRLSLDTIDDFQKFSYIFEKLYKPDKVFSLDEIIKLYEV